MQERSRKLDLHMQYVYGKLSQVFRNIGLVVPVVGAKGNSSVIKL